MRAPPAGRKARRNACLSLPTLSREASIRREKKMAAFLLGSAELDPVRLRAWLNSQELRFCVCPPTTLPRPRAAHAALGAYSGLAAHSTPLLSCREETWP